MSLATDNFADFAQEAEETVGRYRLEFTLSPKTLQSASYCVTNLVWYSIRFDEAEFKKLPNNKRGVYAFVLYEPSAMLPPHGYVAYIGIAGRKSNRSLRARCRDYLNEKKVVKSRQGIARLIGTWREILHVFYAPVDASVTSQTLEQLEGELNGALLPPYSRGDIKASIKKYQKAFP